MDDAQRAFEMLKLITGTVHHFNNLTFNIHALDSTWLLATFAGIGRILKDWENAGADQLADKPDLIIALCISSSVGIFVLWILDLKVYQAFCGMIVTDDERNIEILKMITSAVHHFTNLTFKNTVTELYENHQVSMINAGR